MHYVGPTGNQRVAAAAVDCGIHPGGLATTTTGSWLCGDLHAAELEAVGVGLVVWGQVVVVEHANAEHGRVHAGAQEEDCDEARHLEDRRNTHSLAHCKTRAARSGIHFTKAYQIN